MPYRLFLFFLFFSLHSYGQVLISGKLMDENSQPIPNVSVVYKKVGAGALLGFVRTDDQGVFKLNVSVTDVDSIQLEFNHLSYARLSKVVPNASENYEYMLPSETRQLEEVVVADLPVFRRKDTINYNVDAFTSKQDRVIGDIIKKLPGIEMEGEQIFYRGKPIQKYMVNNLDLMEGRYGIINQNLPADAVKNVQVVENDQPINILDSLVFSDQASLNLELKNFTVSGSGKVGVGLSPGLWDVNLTPMTFGKTFQMLNSLQSNNTGNDAAQGLNAYYTGMGGFLSNDASVQEGPRYVSVQNVQSPGFDQKKWLDNKLFLFSSNVLQKLKGGVELKGNISYYDDTRKQQGFTQTQYFTADETIINTEGVDNRFRINVLDAGALIEKNEKHLFFRNSMKYSKRWNTDRGKLLFNNEVKIDQRLSYSDEVFMNSLSIGRFVGKQLVNIKSKVEWHQTPQKLAVIPGQMNDILNEGIPYDKMTQNVLYKGIKVDNGIGFTRRVQRHWTISPHLDINYQSNTLQTDILLTDGALGDIHPDKDFWNDLRTSQLQLSMGSRLGFEKKKWKLELGLPYHFYRYNMDRQGERKLSNELRSTFNPSAWAGYTIDGNRKLTFNTSARKQYGGLDDLYNSYIIHTYRSIGRYDSRLLATRNLSFSTRYDYKNTLKANFTHLAYSYEQGSRDYIFRNTIDSLGRGTTSIDDRKSVNSNHNLSGGMSRFFASVKTVAKLNAYLGYGKSEYLLNDQLSDQEIKQVGGGLELFNNLSEVISAEYRMNWQYLENTLAGNQSHSLMSHNHFMNISLYASKNSTLGINNSYYGNNISGQKSQYFLDATYRYTIDKWKTDIELMAQNILNNERYVQQLSTDYQLIQSYYDLRPRQVMVSMNFRF